jgi:Na+-driven multidrug efflux pump
LLGILKKQNKRMINVRIRKKILTQLQRVLLFKDSSTDSKGRLFTDSYWKILKLALPVGLEGVFQTSFSLIDPIVVGRLGADAVAGVGLSNSISFIVLLFYSAIGTGSGVLIAQAWAKENG